MSPVPEQSLAFLLFVAAATVSPGGATALATASGARFGIRRSFPFIAGISIGMGAMAVASASGLASLLLALPALELAIRATGTGYLLYLAWRIAWAGSPADATSGIGPLGAFGAAATVLYNPKAWAVTIGAASSFAHLAGSVVGQVLLIGTTFLGFAAVSMGLWCVLGYAFRQVLKSEGHWRVLNAVLGALLAASIIPMWLG
ncbi:MAG TPA: LysE family transporter [Rhizobiaceae bacterium]|nr:LysE family transporter [Rhizobiaceae bacterium]